MLHLRFTLGVSAAKGACAQPLRRVCPSPQEVAQVGAAFVAAAINSESDSATRRQALAKPAASDLPFWSATAPTLSGCLRSMGGRGERSRRCCLWSRRRGRSGHPSPRGQAEARHVRSVARRLQWQPPMCFDDNEWLIVDDANVLPAEGRLEIGPGGAGVGRNDGCRRNGYRARDWIAVSANV